MSLIAQLISELPSQYYKPLEEVLMRAYWADRDGDRYTLVTCLNEAASLTDEPDLSFLFNAIRSYYVCD